MTDLNGQRLLVIAPHPDDEVIGCGGLIQKVKEKGGKVYVLFLTVGDTKDFSKKGSSTIKERGREIDSVAKFLQFDNYHLAFVGNRYHLKLDLVGQKKLMAMIERESIVSIEKVKPTIVAFPHRSSYNQDHRAVAEASHAALRPGEVGVKHFVQTVLSYEEPADGWTLDNMTKPNFFLKLSKKEISIKFSALKLYTSQLRQFPNPHSPEAIRTLAILRGVQSGSYFAEGFFLHKLVF